MSSNKVSRSPIGLGVLVGGLAILVVGVCLGGVLLFQSRLGPRAPSPTAAPLIISAATPSPSDTPISTATPSPAPTVTPTTIPTVELGTSNVFVEYILDASGSMTETLSDGSPKIEVAKQVLTDHMSSFAPETNIGLRAYGHRLPYQQKAESCKDIELIAPVEKGQMERIVGFLQDFKAQGMTPLATSLQQAKEDLVYDTSHINSIVLLSDGIDTCGGDPCKLVAELKAQGVEFTIHVIGLDVDDPTRKQLLCIAQTAGGKYHDARSQQDLRTALDIVKSDVTQGQVIVPPGVDTPTPELLASTAIPVLATSTATPVLPTATPITPTSTPTSAPPKATATPSPLGLIADFETWGTWTRGVETWGTFTQSTEQVISGSYSGKFVYAFPAVPNNYLVYRQTTPIAGQPSALKIMVYGDGSGNYLNAWVQDANNLLWQFTFGRILHTGWQQMAAVLDVSRGWPNQAVGGTPTTAAPVYPLRFYALVLDGYPEDTPLQGAIYVDDLFAGNAAVISPTPTTAPTLTAALTAAPTTAPTASVSISFRADRTSLNAGECTTLRWDVDNVTAVYLDGQGVGGHESRQVCPAATQTYTLSVTRQDGSQQQAPVTIQVAGIATTPTSTPPSIPPVGPCEAIPGESYGDLSIQGPPSDRPAESHADLNLAVRGYEPNNAALQFSDYGPAVDPNGPQLPGLFGDQRTPSFTSTYQVFDWDWGCNCRAGLLNQWDVTLLGMGVNSGEVIRVPDSGRSIGSGYEVLVLYASPDRITLKYTPVDSVVSGYTMHIEDVCVEPHLLGLYQSLNQSGRGRLPALRAGQAFGRAKGGEIKVAIRDGGTFFDPRSRQDWWRGR